MSDEVTQKDAEFLAKALAGDTEGLPLDTQEEIKQVENEAAAKITDAEIEASLEKDNLKSMAPNTPPAEPEVKPVPTPIEPVAEVKPEPVVKQLEPVIEPESKTEPVKPVTPEVKNIPTDEDILAMKKERELKEAALAEAQKVNAEAAKVAAIEAEKQKVIKAQEELIKQKMVTEELKRINQSLQEKVANSTVEPAKAAEPTAAVPVGNAPQTPQPAPKYQRLEDLTPENQAKVHSYEMTYGKVYIDPNTGDVLSPYEVDSNGKIIKDEWSF